MPGGADPDGAGRVDRAQQAFGHAPGLCHRDAQSLHELQGVRDDRGRAAEGGPDLVQAERGPDLGQDLLVGPPPGLGQPGRDRSGLGGPGMPLRGFHRLRTECRLRGSASAASMASTPDFSFSHTRGTPAKSVGRTCCSALGSALASASGATCTPANMAL